MLNESLASSKFTIQEGEKIYKNTCSVRYEKPSELKSEKDFIKLPEDVKEKITNIFNLDRNQVAGTDKDITIEACLSTERKINEAKMEIKKTEDKINGAMNYYENAELSKSILKIDSYLTKREEQMGWINSIIVPATAILLDVAKFNNSYRVDKVDMETARKEDIKNLKDSLKDQKLSYEGDENVQDTTYGSLIGSLVWMSLPGATQIKDFVKDNAGKIMAFIGSAGGAYIGSLVPGLGTVIGSTAGGIILGILGSISGSIIGYAVAIFIMQKVFSYLPMLICATAGVIAFSGYIVSLGKYFFISPFVVAFSLATRKMDKIIDFLINGIIIFFKPILIVIFIYLSLFLYTLVTEIFLFISIEQFASVDISDGDFYARIFVAAVIALFQMFSILAGSYVIWKLIISGPGWTFSMLGLENKEEIISQGLESKLAGRAFIA